MSPVSLRNGAPTSDTLARIMLRPIGSPLPLGVFALVPAGILLAGLQLGWFVPTQQKSVAYLLLGFAVPLQAISAVLAFQARDALVGTGFGIFTGSWVAFALTALTGRPGAHSNTLGVFFLSVAAVFAMLTAAGLVGGKAAAGLVILFGSARFVLSGLYELTGSMGVAHAAGIVGLVFVAVAGYVGVATLLEDAAHRTILPIGRRGMARMALEEDLTAQLQALMHEAGVREQL